MHSLTVDYGALSNEERVALVVLAASVEAQVTCSKAMFVLSVHTLLLKCMMKRL